jgi:hypothetical protein
VAAGDSQALTTSVTKVSLLASTFPVTSQQPSVGRMMKLAQKASRLKPVSGGGRFDGSWRGAHAPFRKLVAWALATSIKLIPGATAARIHGNYLAARISSAVPIHSVRLESGICTLLSSSPNAALVGRSPPRVNIVLRLD